MGRCIVYNKVVLIQHIYDDDKIEIMPCHYIDFIVVIPFFKRAQSDKMSQDQGHLIPFWPCFINYFYSLNQNMYSYIPLINFMHISRVKL